MLRNSSKPNATGIRQKLKASIGHFFKQFRIIRRTLVHPQVPWHAKAVSGCAVLYILSPIQLLPNFVPVIGQMDDVAVVYLALKYLRRFVPLSILEECERTSTVAVVSTIDIDVSGRHEPSAGSTIITSPPGLH